MKPSKILRKSAQLLERHPDDVLGGCHAIVLVDPKFSAQKQGDFGSEGTDAAVSRAWPFFDLMRGDDLYWWPKRQHDARIIGLCLAAAIAESEGQ